MFHYSNIHQLFPESVYSGKHTFQHSAYCIKKRTNQNPLLHRRHKNEKLWLVSFLMHYANSCLITLCQNVCFSLNIKLKSQVSRSLFVRARSRWRSCTHNTVASNSSAKVDDYTFREDTAYLGIAALSSGPSTISLTLLAIVFKYSF